MQQPLEKARLVSVTVEDKFWGEVAQDELDDLSVRFLLRRVKSAH